MRRPRPECEKCGSFRPRARCAARDRSGHARSPSACHGVLGRYGRASRRDHRTARDRLEPSWNPDFIEVRVLARDETRPVVRRSSFYVRCASCESFVVCYVRRPCCGILIASPQPCPSPKPLNRLIPVASRPRARRILRAPDRARWRFLTTLVRTGALVARTRVSAGVCPRSSPYQDCELLTLLAGRPFEPGACERQRASRRSTSLNLFNRRVSVRRVGSRHWRRLCGCARRRPLRRLGSSDGTAGQNHAAAISARAGTGRHRRTRLARADRGRGRSRQDHSGTLILSELKARGAAERVLNLHAGGSAEISGAESWPSASRYSVPIVDMRDLRRRAAALPLGTNPWSTVPAAIAVRGLRQAPGDAVGDPLARRGMSSWWTRLTASHPAAIDTRRSRPLPLLRRMSCS